jgi:signal recognition particle GTPase
MSWLERLRGGFSKTAEKVADNLTGLTSRAALDTSTLDDIEEALIASDLGPEASHRIRKPSQGRSSSVWTNAAFDRSWLKRSRRSSHPSRSRWKSGVFRART